MIHAFRVLGFHGFSWCGQGDESGISFSLGRVMGRVMEMNGDNGYVMGMEMEMEMEMEMGMGTIKERQILMPHVTS